MQRYVITVLSGDQEMLGSLSALADDLNCSVQALSSAGQLMDTIAARPPDLIIVEMSADRERSLDVCRRAKLCADRFVPLIVVGRPASPEDEAAAFDAGADDYLSTPLNPLTSRARIRSLLRLKNALDSLQESREELDRANERLAKIAVEDGLTGLFNHRYMLELLRSEIERAKRYNQPLSCIMIDLDRFAEVNKRYGHVVGDKVLKEVASVLKARCRKTDLICRYGGDEFLIICPHTGLQEARHLAMRLSAALKDPESQTRQRVLNVTASFGVAGFEKDSSITELVGKADKALLRAKELGRDRICLSSDFSDFSEAGAPLGDAG